VGPTSADDLETQLVNNSNNTKKLAANDERGGEFFINDFLAFHFSLLIFFSNDLDDISIFKYLTHQ
jgi:hypothetical protein